MKKMKLNVSLIIAIVFTLFLVGTVNAAGLDVNGVQVSLSGTATYDYINITNGGNVTINNTYGYWNVTANTYFYLCPTCIINGSRVKNDGGKCYLDAGGGGCEGGFNGAGGGGSYGQVTGDSQSGGTGGGGGNPGVACSSGGSGGGGGTGASIISDSSSRFGVFFGAGGGSGGGGGCAVGNGGGGGSAWADNYGMGGAGIRIISPAMSIFGKIYADAGNGGGGGAGCSSCAEGCGSSYGNGGGGGGGGGSAGTILIDSANLNITGANFYLRGGSGGGGGSLGGSCSYAGSAGGQGNGGAGGRIKIFYGTISNSSFIYDVSGGTGASSGTTGSIYYLSIPTTLNVTQNWPVDNQAYNYTLVSTFNCSAAINSSAGGVYLSNISLWTNSTGTWHRNMTTSVSATSATLNFTTYINGTDGSRTLWTCEACTTDNTCIFAPTNRTITYTTTPPVLTIQYPSGNYTYGKTGTNLTMNYTVTAGAVAIDSCWYIYNGNTFNVNCTNPEVQNVTQSGYVNNLIMYANDTAGNVVTATTNWNWRAFQNSYSFNTTTYETASETFALNISSIGDQNMSAYLYYNNVAYATTVSGNNYNTIFTKTLDMGTDSLGLKNVSWVVNYGSVASYNSSTYNQTVNPLFFVKCNSTVNITMINFTFKDEITVTNINGTFNPLTILYYYLGTGNSSKTLIFTNTTTNPNYDFCLNVNRTLYTSMTATYANTGYPSRYWEGIQTLTSTVLNKILYLLSDADGISVFIQLVDSQNNKISGANINVTRNIGGTQTLVSQGTTGNDGGISFWLSPNYAHTFTATKSGCTATSTTFTPTQPQYTLTMSCTGTSTSQFYRGVIEGIIWRRTPLTGVTNVPATGSSQTYVYSLTAKNSNIIGAKFELVNQTTTGTTRLIVNSTSSTCNPSGCTLTLNYKVMPGEHIWGRYYVDVGNGYVLLDGDAHWYYTIQTNASSARTIKNLFDDFKGIFSGWTIVNDQWQPNSVSEVNKAEYSRLVFFFLAMAIVLALASKFTGYDFANPGFFITGLAAFILILSAYNGATGQGYFYYSELIPSSYLGANWVNNYILSFVTLIIAGGVWLQVLANKRG